MDYYKILGVDKDAPDETIRQAYKKLALKHHPDRGGKEDDFKLISEAYSVLSDADKRKMYHHQDFMESMFDNIFQEGGGGASVFNFFSFATKKKMSSRQLSLFVSLEEAMKGSVIPFRVKRKVLLQQPLSCSKCNGQGYEYSQIQIPFGFGGMRTCKKCSSCKGKGIFDDEKNYGEKEEIIRIRLESGAIEGDIITVKGKGNEKALYETGDLEFEIKYKAHPYFTVENQTDLVWKTDINFLEFSTGFSRCIPHLAGHQILLELKPGILMNSFKKYIPGQGLGYKGDLIVIFHLTTPTLPPFVLPALEEILRIAGQDKEEIKKTTKNSLDLVFEI